MLPKHSHRIFHGFPYLPSSHWFLLALNYGILVCRQCKINDIAPVDNKAFKVMSEYPRMLPEGTFSKNSETNSVVSVPVWN